MACSSRDSDLLLAHAGYVRALAQRLVFDRDLAREVEQETWLAALRHGPRRARSPRAWLAVLVRNLAFKAWRGKLRRERREQESARERPSVPTPSEILERESQRREIVEALLTLEEPWRSTLVLRYFEELAPREVAQRLGVPLETVRTRLKRGLELLRERLRHGHGKDGAAWALMLVQSWCLEPLSYRAAATAVAKSMFQGALVMSVANKVVAAGAVLALLVASIWMWMVGENAQPSHADASPRPGVPAPRESGPPALESIGVPAAARDVVANPPLDAPASKAQADGRYGSLLVHVVFAEDRTPAPDVGLRLYQHASDDYYKDSLWLRTRADGSVWVDPILAGGVQIEFDRGEVELLHVTSGERTEVTFELAEGVDVTGMVTDARGAAVADAEIYLQSTGNSHEGHVVARSRADGRYSVRALQPHMAFLSARAPLRAPTVQKMVLSSAGADLVVDLAFEADGGAIEGRVLSPRGDPVPNAALLVGGDVGFRPITLADGSHGRAAAAQRGFTDVKGSFRIEGLAEGEPEVQAQARGFAPWNGTAQIALGRTTSLEIVLTEGVALEGIVRDGAGAAVPDAGIDVNGGYGFAAAHRVSRADGSFEFRGLPSGELEVQVDAGAQGKAQATLLGVEGQTLTWNAVLSRGLILRGLIRAPGRELDGWWVFMNADGGPPLSAGVDALGRFEYLDCPDAPLRVSVYSPQGSSFPVAVVADVRAGRDELVIDIDPACEPSVRIRGRIVDAENRPLPARINPWCSGATSSPIDLAKAEDGSFDLGPYPPGDWRLSVRMDGFAVFNSGRRELAPGETWDLGEIVLLRGGTITLDMRAADDATLEGAHAMLVDANGDSSSLRMEVGRARSERLAPGTYWLAGGARNAALAGRAVEVRADADSAVSLVLEAGSPVRVNVTGADGGPGERVTIALFDDENRCLLRTRLAVERQPGQWAGHLAPGRYRLEARDEQGRSGSIELSIGSATVGEIDCEVRIL